MPKLAARLAALEQLHPKRIDLSLGRVTALLENLGNPHRRLPPVIHVAGTNGKGSTIAFMRAMLEAAGLRVHAYTSPHLMVFNERIRLAGTLATDEQLMAVFDEIEAVNAGAPITFFEITTVAAFLLFARIPADVLLLEVGLGGRLDATNVVTPAVSVITRISMDHMDFLGDTLEKIAAEKAGIIKPGVPVVVGYQAQESVHEIFRARAAELGAPLYEYGKDFETHEIVREDGSAGFTYTSHHPTLSQSYPSPALLGAHQILNAANAITAIKLLTPQLFSSSAPQPTDAIRQGLVSAHWPGRLQRITSGKVHDALMNELAKDPAHDPQNPRVELWYDGAHNDSGAEALAEQCRRWRAAGHDIHLVIGMLKTKDPAIFAPVMAHAETVTAVSMPGDPVAWTVQELATCLAKASGAKIKSAETVAKAITLARSPSRPLYLVAGSLYLASIFSN